MESNLILSESETHEAIISDKYMGGEYCDFKSYYSHIIRELDDDSEYIDESLYFKALHKIGAIERGKIISNELLVMNYRDAGSKWYPPKDVTDEMLADRTKQTSTYRLKNTNTFGFNCSNPEFLHNSIGSRVISLLRRFNDGMKQVSDDVRTGKEAMKAAGLPLSMVDGASGKRKLIKQLLEVE